MRGWCAILFVLTGMLGILTGGVLPLSVLAQEPTGLARLFVERDGELFTVQALYLDSTPDTTALRYTFTVEHTGVSTSRTRQGGTFTPAAGRTDTLSTVRLKAQPGDRLRLHLVVRRADGVVAEITRTEEVPE